MKDLIISLAVDGREKYSERVKGLEASLVHWNGDVRIYKEFPEWCTPHSAIPYAFKYDLMQRALDDGYTRLFWMDSSMRILKNPTPLLDNSNGIVAFDNLGHPVEHWINDTTLANFGITPEDVKGVKQIWGGLTFWDFNTDLAKEVFAELNEQIKLGSFNEDNTSRPGFKASRHDQACLSWILHKRGIELLPYGVVAAKQHITDETTVQYAD